MNELIEIAARIDGDAARETVERIAALGDDPAFRHLAEATEDRLKDRGHDDAKALGPVQSCQSCAREDLRSAFFLGYLPPVNTMRALGTRADREEWYPAELLYCPNCHLVQLGFIVKPEILFSPEYSYRSGTTRALGENFVALFHEACDRFDLNPPDLVVDIGSNDGTLLTPFRERGLRVVGIEPTNAGRLAVERGIPTVISFLSRQCAAEVVGQYGAARLVTATNVFAHIHGMDEAVTAIASLLDAEGVFISESHYLGSIVHGLQYDTVYHEHLRYYSMTSLRNLLSRYGFRVFHVTRIPTHGGSIRVYASRSETYAEDPSVKDLLTEEQTNGLAGDSWIPAFAERVTNSKLRLHKLLAESRDTGARIVGVGAPSRASTLLNFVGLDRGTVECVYEVKGSAKIGKYMPGTNIPVMEETELYVKQPEYALLLSWHISEELCCNLKARGYRGDFIIPLPNPTIIRNEDA